MKSARPTWGRNIAGRLDPKQDPYHVGERSQKLVRRRGRKGLQVHRGSNRSDAQAQCDDELGAKPMLGRRLAAGRLENGVGRLLDGSRSERV
jgi:hypothetical protein